MIQCQCNHVNTSISNSKHNVTGSKYFNKRINLITILYIFIFLIFFFLIQKFPAYSDTVKLAEGSILVGKIISEDKDTIVISNAYGNFKIKRKLIRSLYKTKVYTEDVKILKKLKAKMDEKKIERHIKAGQKKKDELTKDPSGLAKNLDNNGTITLSGSFQYVLSELGEKIPYGYSGHIGIEQGMDMITGKRYIMMPGLRLEGSYMYFSKGSYKITGYNSALGFIWTIPSTWNKTGYFVLAAMPGITLMNIDNTETDKTAKSNTFTGTVITGYRLPLKDFSVFLHARYTYLYDKDIQFHTIGLELGFGYKLW